MKQILFFMMLLFAGSKVAINAKSLSQDSNGVIVLTVSDDTGREIKDQPTQISPEEMPITRGIIRQPAYAYIYNKVISIDFNATIEDATITITNATTGETVYTEISSNPVTINIDLNGEGNGDYIIEIEADGILLIGYFSI
ncbi:DUF3244 domain-containing protein [uncultured Bacteroides sp.]|uniref:DUF3244 domain-containing protein n=1 Tax=uncultured Bacteroides sp. TaxID=162156 RepID=UPI00260EF05D|nr:DUF3244 domain-containing protein [uncultured Bacteroides sp.]